MIRCFNPRMKTYAPLSRRAFLQRSAAATGVLAAASLPGVAAEPAARMLIGSQLYGWGQYYQRAGRNAHEHLDEVFSALRDAGYDYAEGSLDIGNPENNAAFAEKLRGKGLRPVSLYTGGRLHDDRAEETVERLLAAAKVCQAAGFTVINCDPDSAGREKTDEELQRQVTMLKLLGGGLRQMGLRFGIHHHTPAMRSGAREFHYNFRQSAAGTVDFCYDVHWVYRGGVPPMEALNEYGQRVVSWHLRQSRDQIWWEDLDTGDIDYVAVAAFAKKHQLAPLYTVELALEQGTKMTRTVVENHARSLKYVREVFGA
jgi:inosose dehydratase